MEIGEALYIHYRKKIGANNGRNVRRYRDSSFLLEGRKISYLAEEFISYS